MRIVYATSTHRSPSLAGTQQVRPCSSHGFPTRDGPLRRLRCADAAQRYACSCADRDRFGCVASSSPTSSRHESMRGRRDGAWPGTLRKRRRCGDALVDRHGSGTRVSYMGESHCDERRGTDTPAGPQRCRDSRASRYLRRVHVGQAPQGRRFRSGSSATSGSSGPLVTDWGWSRDAAAATHRQMNVILEAHMKTPMEIRAANMAVRDACARQALRRAEGVSAGDVRTVPEVELERWEAVRAQMAPLRLPWGMESAEVLAAVAAHRAYWRPAEVQLLILSESHVWTREAEIAASVPLEVFGHAAAPAAFARLVYCLGYGERDLVQGRAHPNWGSPQFWKLLAAGLDPALGARVVERTEPDLLRRIAAKLRVLEKLKARGVWLLDACPVALYAASQPKPRMTVLAQAMELSRRR